MSFPQMAFWVIFPLAALIVLSGWVMIIISAVKKMRAGKRNAEDAVDRSSQIDPLPPMNWGPGDGTFHEGANAAPLH